MPLEQVLSSLGLFSANTMKTSAWWAFQKLYSLDREGNWKNPIGKT